MSAQCGHGQATAHGNGDSCGASTANGAGSGPYSMTIAGIPLNSPPEVYKNQIHSGAIST